MVGLGYERYTVFGGDVGAGISEQLCLDAGDRVIASLVATDPGAIATAYTPPTDHLTAEEKERHEALKAARAEDFGYLQVQTTRPLSVAYGLTDSPVMQLTWIAEKFQEWTDPSRELPEDAVDLDDLLTLVSVAWFGRGGDGGANLLYEAAHAPDGLGPHARPPAGHGGVRRGAADAPHPRPGRAPRLLGRASAGRPLPRDGASARSSPGTSGRSSRRSRWAEGLSGCGWCAV